MIRTTNVRDGWVDTINVRYVEEDTYKKWTRRGEPRTGDVILTREAPLGEVGILRDARGIFLGQRLVMYRANPAKLDNRFLLYSLLDDDLQGQIKAFGSGSTVEHMRVPDCEKLILQLPPLKTQQKIGSTLSAYDDLIENNTLRIKILEEMARMIYREWFVNFRFPGHEQVKMVDSPLGLIPEGWEVKTLGVLCKIVMGQSPKSEFYNGEGIGLPFHQGVADYGDRFPYERIHCTVENRIAEEGDILFSVRAPVGRLNLTTKKIIIGRGLCAIRSKTGNQAFVFQQLVDQFKEVDMMGGGTIFKSVTKEDVFGIKMVAPTTSVIERFEFIAKSLFRELEVLTFKNQNLRQTRDLLLPKLISGEVAANPPPAPLS
jgi:type I restriction enzyme S subunit